MYGQKLELIKALKVLNEGLYIYHRMHVILIRFRVWVRVSSIVFG